MFLAILRNLIRLDWPLRIKTELWNDLHSLTNCPELCFAHAFYPRTRSPSADQIFDGITGVSTFQSTSWTEKESDLVIRPRGAEFAEGCAGVHHVWHVRVCFRNRETESAI